MASATAVRPAAGLGDAGFFSFRSFRSFFSLGSFFFGAGRTGKARRKLLESSRGIFPYPCSSPAHKGGTRPGSRCWFPPPPALLLEIFDNPAKILQALSPAGIRLWNPAGACPGPCPAGDPRLSTARSCAHGRAPSAGRSPGRAPLAPAPRPFPAAVVPSANLSLWMYQSRAPGGAGAGAAPPALLEGPRPAMLLKRPELSSPCARLRGASSSSSSISVLIGNARSFIFWLCLYQSRKCPLECAGVTPTDSVRGESSASLKPFGHLHPDVSELMEKKFVRVSCQAVPPEHRTA